MNKTTILQIITSLAIFISVSILLFLMGLENWPVLGILAKPGAFFYKSFSWTAWYIPIFLLLNRWIINKEKTQFLFQYLLGTSLIPFLTLALLVQILQGNRQSPASAYYLEVLGSAGSSALFTLFLALEGLVIYGVYQWGFKRLMNLKSVSLKDSAAEFWSWIRLSLGMAEEKQSVTAEEPAVVKEVLDEPVVPSILTASQLQREMDSYEERNSVIDRVAADFTKDATPQMVEALEYIESRNQDTDTTPWWAQAPIQDEAHTQEDPFVEEMIALEQEMEDKKEPDVHWDQLKKLRGAMDQAKAQEPGITKKSEAMYDHLLEKMRAQGKVAPEEILGTLRGTHPEEAVELDPAPQYPGEEDPLKLDPLGLGDLSPEEFAGLKEEILPGDLGTGELEELTAVEEDSFFAPGIEASFQKKIPSRPEGLNIDTPKDREKKNKTLEALLPKGIPHVSREDRGKYAKGYDIPVEGLLQGFEDSSYAEIDEGTREAANRLKETLEEFKIQAEVTGIRKGPVVTMFEILPAPGVKLSKITNLADNIALRLAASRVRIVAPIPGKHAVGIEVPNKKRALVSFSEMIQSQEFQKKEKNLPIVIGKDISGDIQIVDLAKTPHLLIAGATGSGKSVCVNALICSLLYKRSPDEVKMIMVDPKIVELKFYNDIPHLLTPVITEPKKALQAIQWALYEMERRYALLDALGTRDITSYNAKVKSRKLATNKLPYIVIVVDEFADLMATCGKELEGIIARLAAMSRAVGIHLVLATQRPSVDVITGLIKANFPSRIAFMVASKTDSRIILDSMGAEKLLGKGDLLFTSAWDPFPIRMQAAFLSEEEVENVVAHVKTLGEPEYIDDEIFVDEEDDELGQPSLFAEDADPLYDKALEIVLHAGKASASYLQRRLKIGYNRAARLVEEMEQRGIVGPAQGSKPRQVIHIPDRVPGVESVDEPAYEMA